MKTIKTISAALFFLIALTACIKSKNQVLIYLKGAELQYEGKLQKENIITALNDILKLSAEQLKTKKYKDYTGKENKWNLPTLIYRHFVPDAKNKTLGNNFYRDLKSRETQIEIKKIIMRIK